MFRRKPSLRQLLIVASIKLENIMSGVDDLKAAVAQTATTITSVATDLGDVSTKIDTAITLIQKLQQGGGLSDGDAEALAQTLTGASATLTSAQSSLDAEAAKLAAAGDGGSPAGASQINKPTGVA